MVVPGPGWWRMTRADDMRAAYLTDNTRVMDQ